MWRLCEPRCKHHVQFALRSQRCAAAHASGKARDLKIHAPLPILFRRRDAGDKFQAYQQLARRLVGVVRLGRRQLTLASAHPALHQRRLELCDQCGMCVPTRGDQFG